MGFRVRVYNLAGEQVSPLRVIVETAAFYLGVAFLGTALLMYLLSDSRADSIQDVKSRFLIGDGLDDFPFRGPIWYHHIHGSLTIRGEVDYDRFKAWATRSQDPGEIETRAIPGDEYTQLQVRSEETTLRVEGRRNGWIMISGWAKPK